MKKRILATGATVALASSLAAPAAMASTHPAQPTGTKSLATVLTADGNRFDSNWHDYDIVTEAVLAVLKAKPKSSVGVLADGNTPVTAFIPNDRAFRLLARDLTGRWPRSERATFNTLAKAVGINKLESVLLYHVVPGATIDSATALKSAEPATIAQAQLDTLDTNQRLGQARVVRAGASVDLTIATTRPFDARNGFIEVWLINKDGKRMVSVGVLHGSAPETFPITQTLIDQGYIIVDISREGFDNQPQHSGDSLARGTLRT